MTIVNNTVNDCAATVLPDAPIDPAAGLPVPTIAVATDGGMSVIKDDGTVVDQIYSTNQIFNINFNDDNEYFWNATNGVSYVGPIPNTDYSSTSIASHINTLGGRAYYNLSDTSKTIPSPIRKMGTVKLSNGIYASGGGVSFISEDVSTPSKGMVNYITSSYQSGWQNGYIRLAALSDTDDTDLVGSGELVTNGTFDTDTDWTKGTGWTISGGTATKTAGTAADLKQTFSPNMEAGKTYAVTYTVSGRTAGDVRPRFLVDTLVNGTVRTSDGTYTDFMVAAVNNHDFAIFGNSTFDGSVDNISVKLADADRSVNNNGLIVNGTVTRSPVATGADLVAYSGFSSSNYLEQPYNPDLDFGTGDFCVMGWVNLENNSGDAILRREDPGSTANRFGIYIAANEIRAFTNTSVLEGAGAAFGQWDFITLVRRSGTLEFYRGGALKVSQADTNDLTNANAVLVVGIKADGTNPLTNGSLALMRISATAPTAEQIKKIYEDEKVLFQENAQATLYGTSDAVTALAHDPVTDLLHVGTSDGRSVFQGLRRVENTTDAVSTAISASNNLIVED